MKIINDFTEEEFHEMLREEAFEEGVQRGIEQTVRSMLAEELPIDKIVLYTGCDAEKIERIKKDAVGV